jgi:hypothetical protein
LEGVEAAEDVVLFDELADNLHRLGRTVAVVE